MTAVLGQRGLRVRNIEVSAVHQERSNASSSSERWKLELYEQLRGLLATHACSLLSRLLRAFVDGIRLLITRDEGNMKRCSSGPFWDRTRFSRQPPTHKISTLRYTHVDDERPLLVVRFVSISLLIKRAVVY